MTNEVEEPEHIDVEKLLLTLAANVENIQKQMTALASRPVPKMPEQKVLEFDERKFARAIAEIRDRDRGLSIKKVGAVGLASLVLGVALTMAIISPAVLPSSLLCSVIGFEASTQTTANEQTYDGCYLIIK